jgi:hypothetical protein
MTDDMTTEETVDAAKIRYGWPSILVAVVFGVLYAYVLWTAIGNLVSLPALDSALGITPPWWLLVLDVAVPVVVYAAAFFMGRRSSFWPRTLFLLVGFTVIACCTVGSIAFNNTH